MHGIAWARVAPSVYPPLLDEKWLLAGRDWLSDIQQHKSCCDAWPLETQSGLPMSGLAE